MLLIGLFRTPTDVIWLITPIGLRSLIKLSGSEMIIKLSIELKGPRSLMPLLAAVKDSRFGSTLRGLRSVAGLLLINRCSRFTSLKFLPILEP